MMKSSKNNILLVLLAVLCLAIGSQAAAAEAPARQWDGLLDVTHKFSWYPRADLQKLLDVKAAEYGQSLADYRASMLNRLTGGEPPAEQVRSGDFVTGHPWRDYYRLSLAEFCLFLATDRIAHLENAREALLFLRHKTAQPEIEFWYYVYQAHTACHDRDREAFIDQMYRIWQNVVIPLEIQAQNFVTPAAQAGFGKELPFLYENLVHLLIRKAIIEQEIPELYALNVMLLDIQPKLTVENGYKVMAEQVVERMHGPNSDNQNVNFAVALLEATAKRYAFEDEKDPALLAPKFFQARKYYNLARSWADTDKGQAAILTEYAGFMNYVIRRCGDPQDPLAGHPDFRNLPTMAEHQMEAAFAAFDGLAAPAGKRDDSLPEGFADRREYLRAAHQLLDAGAKLAIVLSDFHRGSQAPEQPADTFAAANPLEQYCILFDRHARTNAEALPNNAYFLAAYAARELGGLYREQARFSTGNQAAALALAYQMQAIELFPLDLPAVLQTAFQSSQAGQVQDYFRYARPLAARLRVSGAAQNWAAQNPTEFNNLLALVPTVVPDVIAHAYELLAHVPEAQVSEDVLFTRAVAMGRAMHGQESAPATDTAQRLAAIGSGPAADGETYAFFELKSQLFADPDSPLHSYLRILYNEIPFAHHQYVTMLEPLR